MRLSRRARWRLSCLSIALILALPTSAATRHGAKGISPAATTAVCGRDGACGGGLLTPAAFAGHWTGSWHNTTFDSTGSAQLDSTTNVQAKTYAATLTLGGNVFGAGTPPPLPFGGTTVSANGTYQFDSLLMGHVVMTFGPGGSLSVTETNIPNPNIAKMVLAGTITSTTISMNYTVTFSQAAGGGEALGTILMTKTS